VAAGRRRKAAPPVPGAARVAAAPDPLLRRLVAERGIQEGSRTYLERLRWPQGKQCPRCDSRAIVKLESRRKDLCATCKYQFRVTAGTRMHLSHLPGWKWLVAIDLMMSAPDGLSAYELRRVLGGSYKTAWFLEHRIRAALPESRVPRAENLKPPRAHHVTSAKYRDAYVAEAAWLAASGPASRFRETVRALLRADPLSYDDLVTRYR